MGKKHINSETLGPPYFIEIKEKKGEKIDEGLVLSVFKTSKKTRSEIDKNTK
jgi:hypothetical protein